MAEKMNKKKDSTQVAVIGGGPGGYAAAFRAADLGLEVTLIDTELNPGGVCLYRGCIPSKALLHVAKLIGEARHAGPWGVQFSEPKIDLGKLRGWKESVVNRLTRGLGQLRQQREIEHIQGRASLVDAHTVKISAADGKERMLSFEHAILATGSRPSAVPALALDSPRALDSTSALDLKAIPETLLVIGGGYIGLELGSVYAALGSRVSMVEMTPRLLSGVDRDLVSILQKRVEKAFGSVMLNARVTEMKEVNKGVRVRIEGAESESAESTFDNVLVAVGRKPNSERLGLENTKIVTNPSGTIRVDKQRRNSGKRSRPWSMSSITNFPRKFSEPGSWAI
jgi:dihydrolipoamide dehydrogenase